MVDFISSIITRSLFFPSTLEREKKAVLEELSNLADNPSQEIYNVFHKAFFTREGLQYMEDCALQIKNVASLTMKDIKTAYEAFHTENCLFVVYGDFDSSIESHFEKSLVSHPGKKVPIENCFTYKHDILYTKYDKENTTLFLGFPSTKRSFFIPYFEVLLHHLLFHELRTKHQYIYDIQIRCMPSQCGVVTEIEINVQTKNALKTFHALLDSLRKYQKKMVSDKYIDGAQKNMYYKYNTSYDFVEYYALYEPFAKKEIVQKRKEFTPRIFRELCNELCPIEKSLCVYQSKQKLSITWDSL